MTPLKGLACVIATWTARIMGHALTVLAFTVITVGCGVWSLVADNAMAANVALSVAALDITAAVLFVSERDTRMILRALAEIVRAVPEADNAAMPAMDALEKRRMG